MEVTLGKAIEKEFIDFLSKGEPPCDYEKALLENHFDRVSYILDGGNPPPYELEIQPSSLCNLCCTHCFGREYKRLPDQMNEEALQDIARKVDEFERDGFKIEVVKFCGTTGEPLLNPVIAEGIETFKKLGKKIIVFTNGLWLDESVNGQTHLDYILKADKLNLSLDAGSEETFTRIKGIRGFNRIINSLGTLVEKRDRTSSNLNIVVSYVIGRENYSDIVQAAEVVRAAGADTLLFRVDFTDKEGVRAISNIILKNLIRSKDYSGNGFKIIPVYSPISIAKDDSQFHSYGRKCFNRYFWACIGSDCNLYACGHRTHGGIEHYGSLLNNSFSELWNSKERLESAATLPDDHCKVCSPSSSRRNDFMTFLAGIPKQDFNLLCKKYV